MITSFVYSAEAVQKAYEQVNYVHFANAFYRRDIGARALREVK